MFSLLSVSDNNNINIKTQNLPSRPHRHNQRLPEDDGKVLFGKHRSSDEGEAEEQNKEKGRKATETTVEGGSFSKQRRTHFVEILLMKRETFCGVYRRN